MLHSRVAPRQLFEAAVDLRAVHADILEMAIVELAQSLTRGVPFVARNHRRNEAIYETAQARQPTRSL